MGAGPITASLRRALNARIELILRERARGQTWAEERPGGARAKGREEGTWTLATPRGGGFQALVTGVKAIAEDMGGGEASTEGGPGLFWGPGKGEGSTQVSNANCQSFVQRRLEAMGGM